MPREASTRALAGAQHEAPGTPWAPCPATSAKLAKAQPCCKELLVPPSPKTAPSCSITPTAAPTALVSKPAGQWHSRWCSTSLLHPVLPCCCMCLLVPGQGPGSPLAHCRSLHHFPHPACHCRHFPIWSSWGERQAGRHVAATATRHQAARPGETTPWSWCEMCQLDIAAR